MKSYSQVYNASKADVLGQRKAIFDTQKIAIVNVLKEEYMITGKMSELPADKKKDMAKRVLEYWSPKTGINAKGIKLLNENVITLSPNSNIEDIKLYIQKQTKKNIEQLTECFRAGETKVIVETFNDDIKSMIGRSLKEKFIVNTVWDIISNRIKNGL
jgi:hypothetical protein